MILNVFTVFDEKAKAFLPPFFMTNPAVATRAFADCINDPNHQWGKHPSDYTLWRIAEWDDASGSFRHEKPELVIAGPQARRHQAVNPAQTDFVGNEEIISIKGAR